MYRTQNKVIIVISILFFLSIPQLSYTQENDLQEAKSLTQQSIELYKQGRYSEAIPLATEVLAISEKVFGPKHPNYSRQVRTTWQSYIAY